MEAMRITTMGGMISNPISNDEQIREIPSLKNDHDWSRCQAFQPIRVFGTHTVDKGNALRCAEVSEPVPGEDT